MELKGRSIKPKAKVRGVNDWTNRENLNAKFAESAKKAQRGVWRVLK